MNIDKMRKEFEAKYPMPSGVSWSDGWGYVIPDSKSDLGSVWALSRHLDLWDCWQASRASVVIELPQGGYFAGYDNEHMMESRDVRDAIEAAGLKVKP